MATFAIIGTRNPDQFQRELAKRLAASLSGAGHAIRTGGAYGIDQAAIEGTCEPCLEVVLPWASYNREIIPKHARVVVYDLPGHHVWHESVRLYHPKPDVLKGGAYALHARNYGILWPEPTIHVKRVIAMPDASGGGGTGQGIRIAKALSIPCTQINRGQMKDRASLERVFAHILKLCIA